MRSAMRLVLAAGLAILSSLTASAQDRAPEAEQPASTSPLPRITKDSAGRISTVTTVDGTTRYSYFEGTRRALIAEVTPPDGVTQKYTLETAAAAYEALFETSGTSETSSLCSGTNRIGFNGYFADCELGLYFTPSGRFYDPSLGRFIQQDSELGEISNPPSLHRYTFGHDNPTSFVDPTGHESYRQWIYLDKPSPSVGHEFLKDFGYSAFNVLSFGALGRQDTLVEQSEVGKITEAQYRTRTRVNAAGSTVAAAATIYTAGAAAGATAGAVAPLAAATELGVSLLPAAVVPVAAGAAAGGVGTLSSMALSDDVAMLTGTVSPLDVHASAYIAPTALGIATGGVFGAGAAAGIRPFGKPAPAPPPSSDAFMVGEGPGGASAQEQFRLAPIRGAAEPTAPSPGRPADSRLYSTVFEAQLRNGTLDASDASHFRQGNRQLHELLQQDQELAARLGQQYPGIAEHVTPGPRGGIADTAPPGLTWHHHPTRPGVLQLVPRVEHRAPGAVQSALHPEGRGGRENWGGGRGQKPPEEKQ
jgi:RHS repeat-associated protein